jgi:hypothetical protein
LKQKGTTEQPQAYDCKIFDAACLVHALPITEAATFKNYADKVFIPYMLSQLQSTRRVDMVWDTYIPDSIKESTREKRGKGVRRKVGSETKLPGNWADFLQDSTNKQELFAFLSCEVAKFSFSQDKEIYITSGTFTLY